jgi:hypothetical protein
MSVASNEDGKKWIQTSVALTCILLGYVLISFFGKMNEWFHLETMIPFYELITQVLSVGVAGITAYVILTNPKSSEFKKDGIIGIGWDQIGNLKKYAYH